MTRVAELSAEITAETGDFERGLSDVKKAVEGAGRSVEGAEKSIDGLDKGMSNVEKTIAGTRTTIANLDKDLTVFGKDIGSVNDALNGMGISIPTSPMAALGQAVGFVGQQMKAAVTGTVDYAVEVRNLGRTIGATAEEASMLIQAAANVDVSVGSLTSALQAAIRNGLEPSVDGLSDLAEEYNAIQDPIERTKFLMDKFGRSGADLAPLMEQGAAGIRELGDAARETGLVLSEEAVAAALEYKDSVEELETAWKGFSTQVGSKTIPLLTQLFKSTEVGYGSAKVMGTTIEEVTEKLQPHIRGLEAASRMTDMFTGAQTESTDAQDQATRSSHYWTAEMWRAREAIAAMSKPLAEAARGFDRFSDAMTDAALSGVIQGAQEDYLAVIKETTPEIARLTEHIAVLNAEHGQTYTYTRDATTTVVEYENATIKAAVAAQKLAEYVGDDALELSNLKVNAEHASENVVKLGEGMGMSAQFTMDHTKHLAEDSAAMAEMVAKQAEAEEALRKTTAEFVLQQAAASLTGQALLEFAHATGLMDDASYNLAGQIQFLTGVYDTNRDGIVNLDEDTLGYAASLATLTEHTITATMKSAESQPVHLETADSLLAVRDAAEAATDGIVKIPDRVEPIDTYESWVNLEMLRSMGVDVTNSINAIPRSVTIDVITNNHTNYSGYQIPGAGGQGDHAAGVDMFVPPGFPHDSYQMNVQSGEHVVVTPAGGVDSGRGGARNVYNFNFNNAQPVSVPTALQTARSVADAW